MSGRVLIAMAVLLAAVGCDDGASTQVAMTPAVPSKPRPPPDAGVSLTTSEPYQYTYSPVGKRDPFRSLTSTNTDTSPSAVVAGQSPCDEVLCQFDLDDLKLVAVVSGDANPVAMVEDRNGVGHVLRRNTKVGRQAGKVTAILRDCVVVTSFVAGPDGRQQPNRQSLCVSPEGGASPVLDLLNGKPRE